MSSIHTPERYHHTMARDKFLKVIAEAVAHAEHSDAMRKPLSPANAARIMFAAKEAKVCAIATFGTLKSNPDCQCPATQAHVFANEDGVMAFAVRFDHLVEEDAGHSVWRLTIT